MKLSYKSAVSGVAAAALAGGMFLIGAAPASAAAPSFEPDPQSVGSVTFYNASGSVISSGAVSARPFAAYFAASGTGVAAGDNLAQASFATPQDGVPTALWSQDTSTGTSNYGSSVSHPGALAGSNKAIAAGSSQDINLEDYIGEFPAASTANPNIYQVRIYTNQAGNGGNAKYYSADIQVSGSTWTQVYPAPSAPAPSISAITASPASPAAHGSTVSLSATVTNPAAGSVHLFDGSSDKGAATYNATSGSISASDTPADGAHSYKFTLTPTDSSVSPVSSAALSYTVNAPVVQNTTTVVSGPTTGTVGDTVTYTATVKAGGTAVGANAGKVQFIVDGNNVGSPVAVTNGAATFAYNLADTSPHTITAAFTHTSGQLYNDSTDTTGVTVTATAATTTPDPQDVVVNVPAGTLVISTPYTAANPFILGNLALDANGTGYTASADFGNTTATAGNATADANATSGKLPAGATAAQVDAAKAAQQAGSGNGITVTDTRANSQGWVAAAQTTDFTNPALNTPIDGNNLTFHDLKVKYVAGNAIQTGVNTQNIDNFKTSKKTFATNTNKQPGTVGIAGTLTLTAPTSTKAGQYTATITFTVV